MKAINEKDNCLSCLDAVPSVIDELSFWMAKIEEPEDACNRFRSVSDTENSSSASNGSSASMDEVRGEIEIW